MNIDRIAKSLKLKKQGYADGAGNIPAASDARHDVVAQRIDAEMADIIKVECEAARESVREICGWISNIYTRLEGAVNRLHRIYNQGLSNMDDMITDGCGRLWQLHREYQEAYKSLENFKKIHKLQRIASYPNNNLWNWGLLIFIFSVEVAVNGFTLQDVHPEGFIGIVTAMFMISFINITVGLGAGFMYRYTNHSNWIKCIGGWGVTAALIAALLLFNGLVGHWRSTLISFDADINIFSFDTFLGIRLIENFTQNPLILSDFKSYLMAIVGFVFGFIALWKGYRWEDSYPGYSRVTMMVDDYSDQYQYQLNNNRQWLRKIKNDAIDAIVALGNSYDGDAQLALDYEREVKDSEQRFKDFIASAQKNGAYLYTVYRSANKKKRTEAAPACFDDSYEIPSSLNTIGNVSVPSKPSSLSKDNADIHNLSKQLERKLSEVYSAYLEVYQLIDSVESMDAGKRSDVEARIKKIRQQHIVNS